MSEELAIRAIRASIVALLLSASLLFIRPALAQRAGEATDSGAIVAAGDPALTQDMVARFTDILEWAIDSPLTGEQRDRIRALLVDAWKKNRRSDMAGTLQMLAIEKQVAALPADQRDVVRMRVTPELVKSLKQQTDQPLNRWLLDIYEAAHQQIASGNPPLTRQASDALAEMFAFILGEVAGQPFHADSQFKQDFSRWLAVEYPKQPAERQAQMAQSPVIWASLRVIWSRASEADRAKLRKQWAEGLGQAAPSLQARQAVEKDLQELQALAQRRANGALTPTELDHAAAVLSDLGRKLRAAGGEDAAQQAAQVAQAAETLRHEAASARAAAHQAKAGPPSSSKRTASGKASAVTTMAQITARHNAFMSMMNMQMQLHWSRMNTINTLGGSPYRYVNAYGRPY